MYINKFYAYVWMNEEGVPYYVGKGFGERAYTPRPGEVPQPPIDRGRVSVYPCDSEDKAFELEKELIVRYGRKDLGTGCLENRSSGGEGWSGKHKLVKYEGRLDKFSRRVLMFKVPDIITVEEDLYYVMQCAAKGALCRFINYGVESDELANELYIKWRETGLRPRFRKPIYRGKPTQPAKVAILPMGKWELYHIFKSDFLHILAREGRRLKNENYNLPHTE